MQNFKGTHKKQPPFPKICLFAKNIIVKKNTFKVNKSQGKENSRLEVNKTHLTMSIPLIYHWFCFDLHQKRHTVFKHRNLLARVVALKIIWSWHLENTLPSNLNFDCTCADVFDLFVRLVWLLSLCESSFINSPQDMPHKLYVLAWCRAESWFWLHELWSHGMVFGNVISASDDGLLGKYLQQGLFSLQKNFDRLCFSILWKCS